MKQVKGFIFYVAVLLISGCATLEVKKPPENLVQDRAQARLNALLKGDIASAWSYATPAYRQSSDREKYSLQVGGAANWTSAEVERVTCEMDRCDVRVLVSYEIKNLKIENTRILDEVWIQADGQWWIFHSR